MTDLAGRAFLVTGANAGIGYATAHELASRGGRVYVGSRSKAKGEAAVTAIRAATGNDQVLPLNVDLADLASVRRAAQTVIDSGEPLHVLINNAGVGGVRGQTADGFELHFGVNHLGHFALTQALLPLLTASAPARVVNVASDSHYQAKGINFEALRHRTKGITGLPEYAVSKLCNVLHAAELGRQARRHRRHHVLAAPWRGRLADLAAGAVAGAADRDQADADHRAGCADVAVLRHVG